MNPYEVLGVTENATDEEIKAAYRKLVKKYHPDRFANDPQKQAAASEKLKQVNAAYDMVTKIRQGNYQWSNTPEFASVRAAIQRGAIGEAEAMLNRMSERPAEWHFLMGIVLLRRGWYDGAAEHFTRAYQMEPGNKEYENAMRAMSQQAGAYMDFGDMPEGGIQMNGKMCIPCGICACAGLSLCCGRGMFCCI